MNYLLLVTWHYCDTSERESERSSHSKRVAVRPISRYKHEGLIQGDGSDCERGSIESDVQLAFQIEELLHRHGCSVKWQHRIEGHVAFIVS